MKHYLKNLRIHVRWSLHCVFIKVAHHTDKACIFFMTQRHRDNFTEKNLDNHIPHPPKIKNLRLKQNAIFQNQTVFWQFKNLFTGLGSHVKMLTNNKWFHQPFMASDFKESAHLLFNRIYQIPLSSGLVQTRFLM